MPFTLPVFNITCNIWHAGFGPPGPPQVVTLCNLQYGRKRAHFGAASAIPIMQPIMWLLLPKLTDIRGNYENAPLQGDLVECPAGTGRFYNAMWIDDVAKGFANEYRVAILQRIQAFPVPIP